MNLQQFQQLPVSFRPTPLWSWNDRLVKDELKRQIDKMTEGGFGGFFMHPRVGILTKYNTPEWYDVIRLCAEKAKENGVYAWLYDEDRWPSGYGSGEVAQTEEFRSRALILLENGKLTKDDTVLSRYSYNGVDYIIAKRVSPMGDPWFNGTSYVDLMNPKAVRKFLDCTHERYKKHCGQYFGKEIPGIFTDEPSYLLANNYDMPVLPWSECLEEYFEKRHGYKIKDYLAELFFDINDYPKIRYDFFDSASNLFLESYTKQYYKWCDENNLKMIGHFMAEDSLNYQIQWIGNAMPHYEYMHCPGIDKLGRRVNQNVTVKQVASVADQLGKERTFSEVYGCIGQHCGFRERKWIADWQGILGINFVNPHLSLYSMRGERKRDFPSTLSYHQPWWNNERNFADYITRVSSLAAYGTRDVKILMLHTVESAWCTFKSHCDEGKLYESTFGEITDKFIEENLDFHYGDESIMERHGIVKDGKFSVGNYSYDIVVIPPAMTIKKSTYKLLEQFSQCGKGENIIFVSPYPTRIDGEKVAFTPPKNAVYATSIADAVAIVNEKCNDKIRTIDKQTGKNAKKIYCCSKFSDSNDKMIMLANIEPKREINAEIIIKESRVPYLLNLSDGKLYEIPYKKRDNAVHIDVLMYAAGSFAVIFTDDAVKTQGKIKYLESGVTFDNEDNLRLDTVATDYKLKLSSPNVLPLNRATVLVDGEIVAENKPMPALWKEHFYSLRDGTLFEAKYEFNVLSLPKKECFAVVECAENLDGIWLNNVKLKPLKDPKTPDVYDEKVNYIDVHFVKIPLKGLKCGKNILHIKGVKMNNTNGQGGHTIIDNFYDYSCTELDTAYIIGDFSVYNCDNTTFSIDGNNINPNYENLTTSGYPFYAGNAVITAKITNNDSQEDKDRKFIRLNFVNGCGVTVKVNGNAVAMRYMKPYIMDVTDYLVHGDNEVEVEITGTLFNLMGPNWIDNIESVLYVSPEVFENLEHYTNEYIFKPFGVKSIELVK